MKKILFFIPTLSGGGAEKVLVNLVNNLNREKYEVTVLTLFDTGINKKYLAKHIHYKFIFKRLFRGNTVIFRLFSPEFLARKFIGQERYDIAISFLESPATRIIAALDDDTKKIQWIHNEYSDENEFLKCYSSKKEFIKLQNNFDRVIYVAETVKSGFHNLFPELKLSEEILYNPIDTDSIRKLSEEKSLYIKKSPIGFHIVSVGRLHPQKGHSRLLDVMSKVINMYPQVTLEILGEGELRGELEQKIKALGLQDNIKLIGYHENPYARVKSADLFICSSLHEGFSTAVTEALIVNTPVLTTDCSGMKELLGKNNEYGMIVENSESGLYEGLMNLLKNPEKLEKYKHMAQLKSDSFDLNYRMEKIEQMLDSLL